MSTFIVPRDTQARLAAFIGRPFLALFRRLAGSLPSYEAKDNFLAFQGPLFLLTLLLTWLALLTTGYALMLWGAVHLEPGPAFREAGSSMLTLGFATTRSVGATAIDLSAAASGLIVVALLIGYLPVLYAAFNRRERTVTLLESRAGAPAWGPEILWRHHQVGILDSLPDFYLHWEGWCADVAETHSTYPVLLFFRSPDPMRSWLTGLVSVLDSAALYNSLSPQRAPSEARLCLRMGFTTLRALATTMAIPFDPDPQPNDPIVLTYEEYMRGVQRLVEIDFPMERSAEEAWLHFRGWRVNYEPVAFALAERVMATPGQWSTAKGSQRGDVIPTKRPLDRTPDEPEGTKRTRPGSYDTG